MFCVLDSFFEMFKSPQKAFTSCIKLYKSGGRKGRDIWMAHFQCVPPRYEGLFSEPRGRDCQEENKNTYRYNCKETCHWAFSDSLGKNLPGEFVAHFQSNSRPLSFRPIQTPLFFHEERDDKTPVMTSFVALSGSITKLPLSCLWRICISYKHLKLKGFTFQMYPLQAPFYSEIPLPFPNSSYLLEPSNPMANAEMRFLRLYNNLNQAIGLQ